VRNRRRANGISASIAAARTAACKLQDDVCRTMSSGAKFSIMPNHRDTLPADPREEYYHDSYPLQQQPAPGLEGPMQPRPDTGEESYRGHGRLLGRKALVTGGDSGIGRAVAIAFAREGADLAVNYLPAEEPDAESLKRLLDGEGSRSTLLAGDLSDERSCRRIVREAIRALEGIDILVLNAGTQHAVEQIADLSTDQLEHTFATNVFSLFWCVQEALPHLAAGSSIITTSSIEAFQPSPHLTDYAASKSAVVGFTRSLAKQLAPKGIRVNSVAPGPVWTPLQVSGGQQPGNIPEFGSRTPMGRAGQPVEVAPSYVFLASDEASYITAQVIGVTGGRYIL